MKISIITTTYNSSRTVEETIKSVLSQSYFDLEFIIVDGGSTDGTLDIIDRYKSRFSRFSSEKDEGMYDAMNKGIKLATGDIIGILNSDDVYVNNDILNIVMEKFEETNADCVWGDLEIVDKKDINKVVRSWKSGPYKEGSFQRGWHPPHPGFFVKKELYDRHGLFRTDMLTWADYELQLRLLEKHKISSAYISQTLVRMRDGGKSNKSIWWQMKANFGCYKAFKINNLKVSLFFIFKKPLYKLWQFKRLF